MKALVNFKICDNARECSGIEVCPTKAMYFNEELDRIEVDNEKCTNCGICEKECPIGAISVGKNEEEYYRYVEEIENDPRTTKDLFVDRYGAISLSKFFLIKNNNLEDKLKKEKLIFVEMFDSKIAECLLRSIPIKNITDNIDKDIHYYKLDKEDVISKKYDVIVFPTLLIFNGEKLLGSVEGYYTINQKQDFEDKINGIINKNI